MTAAPAWRWPGIEAVSAQLTEADARAVAAPSSQASRLASAGEVGWQALPPVPITSIASAAPLAAHRPASASTIAENLDMSMNLQRGWWCRSGCRRGLQVDAEAHAGGAFAAAEGAAKRERGAVADALAVADRQRALAALEAGAHRDAPARALAAGGVDRHVQHRRAHRALAVDALVLAMHAPVDVLEAVVEGIQSAVDGARVESGQRRDLGVGVAVGRSQGAGVAGAGVVARGVEGGFVAGRDLGA